MTKRDHGELARIFKRHLEDATGDESSYDAITALVDDFAFYAERDSPSAFDRDKFFIACGIGIV